MSDPPIVAKSLLAHISTHWPTVEDPAKFVLRYAPAIRGYIAFLLKGAQDVDDVTQEFLTHVMNRGFSESQITRGRFRDYLRAAVRNAAYSHFRAKRTATIDHRLLEETLASPQDSVWTDSWRACLLDSTWQRLRQFQKANPGNMYHTILKLATDRPEETAAELAERIKRATDKELRPDAFRQQHHRARRKFAELLVEQVEETIVADQRDRLDEELCELGLDAFVRDYLA